MKRIACFVMALLAEPALAQWLPPGRDAHERALWALTKVDVPPGLRFYDLPPVSQRLVGIVPMVPENRFGIFRSTWRGYDGKSENVNAMMPWATPSGLHNSPKSQWRKVAGAAFTGKIAVDVENVSVQNGIPNPRGGFFRQNQPQVTWRFPDGTTFVEMIVRVDGDYEWPMEIRQYTINGGKFTEGTTYRPDVPLGEQVTITVPPGKLTDFGFTEAKVKASVASSKDFKEFKASREIITAKDDNGLVPRGFAGNVRSCVDCHRQAGKPTGYGLTTIRGSGDNLSWHPFTTATVNSDADPVLDARWPLDIKSGRLKAR